MCLQLLELLVRVKVGVLVVKAHDHTKQDLVGLHVVHEATSVDIIGQRPPNRVLNESLFEMRVVLWDFPYFFKTQAIVLLTNRVLSQLELFL